MIKGFLKLLMHQNCYIKNFFPKILILGSPDPGNYASVDESLVKDGKKKI